MSAIFIKHEHHCVMGAMSKFINNLIELNIEFEKVQCSFIMPLDHWMGGMNSILFIINLKLKTDLYDLEQTNPSKPLDIDKVWFKSKQK